MNHEHPRDNPYVAFDLDGTLAHFNPEMFQQYGYRYIGDPIPTMVELVKDYIKSGIKVKIMTARVAHTTDAEKREITGYILNWLKETELPELEITCIKDYNMIKLYDDRCEEVFTNKGFGPRNVIWWIYEPMAKINKDKIKRRIEYVRDSDMVKSLKRLLEVMTVNETADKTADKTANDEKEIPIKKE